MNSCLKTHGGKAYLAKRIVALMPPHLHYVEPYAGGLSVLLAKDPEGVSEVVNDVDGELTNFWRVLADPTDFADFSQRIRSIPFSEDVWRRVMEHREQYGPQAGGVLCGVRTDVMDACGFFVRCRQSLAGRGDSFAPLSRNRTRRGMNEQASAWLSAVEGLPEVHARLKRVVILNRDALDVIRQQDGENTLFYLDPPYLPETRTSPEVYEHEMTEEQHRELLTVLSSVKGKFLLSGYPSTLYEEAAYQSNWSCHEFSLPNNAAGGETKRRMTECLWTNF